jgi:Ca2+-binding RTX toxin-like protein
MKRIAVFVSLSLSLGFMLVPEVSQATHDAECRPGSLIYHVGNSNFGFSHLPVDQCVQGGDAGQSFNGTYDLDETCVPDQTFAEGGPDVVTYVCVQGSPSMPNFAEGNEGNDELNGSPSVDDFNGGSGADDISGGNGNDRVFDGSGVDTLTGNGGSSDMLCYAADGNGDQNDAQGFEVIVPDTYSRCQ